MLIEKRPQFVGWIAVLVALPFQFFTTLWTAIFFGGIVKTVLGLHSSEVFYVFGTIAFVGFPCVAYIGKKINYQRTVYRFHETFLDFEEGFFSTNKKIVHYRDIVEVTLRRGFLQRSVGLGTIYLATAATGSSQQANPFYALGFGNVSASGIGVRDVNDPDAAFEQIRRLIDEKRQARP